MNKKLIGHGFIAPDITPDNFILGDKKLPEKVLQKNGNWFDFLPIGERQAYGFETYGCTIYNTLQIIETLQKRLLNTQHDYAERAVYIGTGTQPPGNNPHVIAEWIRNNGLAGESLLSFDSTIQTFQDYISSNPLPQSIINEMNLWKRLYDFGHEWVFKGEPVKEKHERLKYALTLSPIGVSVVGWKEHNGIYVKDEGEPDNHWTDLVAYDGIYPIVYDSYPPFFKKLSPDYDFGFAKRYSLNANNSKITNLETLWEKLSALLF